VSVRVANVKCTVADYSKIERASGVAKRTMFTRSLTFDRDAVCGEDAPGYGLLEAVCRDVSEIAGRDVEARPRRNHGAGGPSNSIHLRMVAPPYERIVSA
jgi:hypothetical protein